MTPPWSLPSRLEDERRYDGPIPAPDSDAAPGRARLFQRLAVRQWQDLVRLRAGLSASQAQEDVRLGRCQRELRYYRDHGASWTAIPNEKRG